MLSTDNMVVSDLTSYAATTGSEVVNLKSSIMDVGQGLEGQLCVLKRRVEPDSLYALRSRSQDTCGGP